MVNQQHKNLEKFILSDLDLHDEFSSSFLDPGVSNSDVDWLFRGREVKKLTKRSNTINNEVQSHLLQAQQKALIESMGKDGSNDLLNSPNNSDISIIDSNINLNLNSSQSQSQLQSQSLSQNSIINSNTQPINYSHTSSPVSIPLRNDTPLKSSLKSTSASSHSSGLKIDTSNLSHNSPSNNIYTHSLTSQKSTSSSLDSNNSQFINSTTSSSSIQNHISTPTSATATATATTPTSNSRSRSSSILFGRQKSPSNASENKPMKKSLLSTLSSKLKSNSITNSNAPNPNLQSPIKQSPVTIVSPTVSKNVNNINKSHDIKLNPFIHNNDNNNSNNNKNNNTNTKHKIKPLENISFKRVCFALDDLIEDPQQQIPSRRPKKGNVLIPEDMLAPPPKLSIGITNSFNEQTKDQKPNVDPKLYEQAVLRQKHFLSESKKHSEEAHIAALRMAKEVSCFKKRKGSFLRSDDDDDEDEEENITDSRFISKDDDIDTPLHEHVNYFGNDDLNSTTNDSTDLINEINLETLYTRCCHLREILPIPATLKQLKDKTKPLPVIKMLNPRPTLIDILSFSDFLAIAPVITVIFDNVTIDTEMLKIILVSLKNSRILDKLSLRNVPIDQEGWKFVCKFLETNKSIQKLDISQQRIKKNSDNSKTILRSELDWNLFTDILALRGGIEELVLNGCILNLKQFDNLVSKSLILKTKKLGLASSQLDVPKMEILSKWISDPNSKCIGVDFAFNDLSLGQLTSLNKSIEKNSSNIKLQFFSLNSTDVTLKECSDLIKNLSYLKTLRFLDLSNNPHLFPDIIPVLRDNLPNYPDLRRIHFDFDNLTEFTIVQLGLLFQKCPKLVHVSILGNKAISPKTISALYSAVKNSHIYNLDMDYEGLDEELVSRIAFFLMRNMESFLNANSKSSKFKTTAKSSAGSDVGTIASADATARDEDLIFDGSLLTKAAEHLLETDLQIADEERLIIYRSLVDKTIKLREEIQDAMNRLFASREKGKLSIEGKENLLRLCLLDDSLENILALFADEVKSNNKAGLSINSNSATNDHSRPNLMRNLSSQLTRHLSNDKSFNFTSNETIDNELLYQHPEEHNPIIPAEEPHIVVTDADSVPVDSTTGQRVLMRNFSQTSLHAKKLEEEEGELHRWGFFVQQQNDIMPDDSQNSNVINVEDSELAKKEREEQLAKEMERLRIEAEEKERLKVEAEKKKLKINAIPSGSELRETIMKAKGIESISDLIKKVNKDFTTVEKIYKHVDPKRVPREISPISETSNTVSNANGSKFGFGWFGNSTAESATNSNFNNNINANSDTINPNVEKNNSGISDSPILDDELLSPTLSHNSTGDIKDADEVYERILNNVIRVRSNK
jgi:hypothetical protein